MSNLLFLVGNVVALIGGFFAMLWVVTSSRHYWRKRRRGWSAVVFFAVGCLIMYVASRFGAYS